MPIEMVMDGWLAPCLTQRPKSEADAFKRPLPPMTAAVANLPPSENKQYYMSIGTNDKCVASSGICAEQGLFSNESKVCNLNDYWTCTIWITQCTHERSNCDIWITQCTHKRPNLWFSIPEWEKMRGSCLGTLPIKNARSLRFLCFCTYAVRGIPGGPPKTEQSIFQDFALKKRNSRFFRTLLWSIVTLFHLAG